MTPVKLLFFLFSATAVFSALMVIFSKNPVRAVLFLVATFLSTACLWLVAQAEFLALILVVVYVGAVMTLFLFVVMMIDIDVAKTKRALVKYAPVGGLVVVLLVLGILFAVKPEIFPMGSEFMAQHPATYSDAAALGEVLYTEYAYPFELAAVLLLIAIIAAITLAYRGPRNSKTQIPEEQILVRKENRIRLVDIPSEKED